MDAWYASDIHLPFERRHEQPAATGALLVHGFTGSPFDMVPLADLLFDLGVGVHVVSLPGMAKDILRLNDVTGDDWLAAVRDAWEEVRSSYEHTILLGYSLGGALAALTASSAAPDQLMLIAPLTRIATPAVELLPIGKYLLPNVRQYRNTNWDDPAIHEWFQRVRPGVDTTDKAVQTNLESSGYSLRMIDSMRALIARVRKIRSFDCPALVYQGTDDTIVLPGFTRKFVSRLRSPLTYTQFPGDHYLPLRGMPYHEQLMDRLHHDIAPIVAKRTGKTLEIE